MTAAACAFLVYTWPLAADDHIPLVVDTREEAEHMAQMLADKYGTADKAAAPLPIPHQDGARRQAAS